MASKMPAAHDANDTRITISMAEQQQYHKPLQCEYCEALVLFVNAFTRQVGEDIVAVEPFFRLHNGYKHSTTCRYNVYGQVTVIAKESEGDIFAALQDNRYELRLLAVKKAVEQLRELAKKKRIRILKLSQAPPKRFILKQRSGSGLTLTAHNEY